MLATNDSTLKTPTTVTSSSFFTSTLNLSSHRFSGRVLISTTRATATYAISIAESISNTPTITAFSLVIVKSFYMERLGSLPLITGTYATSFSTKLTRTPTIISELTPKRANERMSKPTGTFQNRVKIFPPTKMIFPSTQEV